MNDLFLLSEAQMRRIEPYFPLSHGVSQGWMIWLVISGIIFVIRNGLRWCDAPRDYGPAQDHLQPVACAEVVLACSTRFRRVGAQGW